MEITLNLEIQRRMIDGSQAAASLAYLETKIAGAKPVLSECHQNVDKFVAENAAFRAIRGWLFSSGFKMQKHSVVRDESGRLLEITFPDCTIPFFVHPGTEEEFWSLDNEYNLLGPSQVPEWAKNSN